MRIILPLCDITAAVRDPDKLTIDDTGEGLPWLKGGKRTMNRCTSGGHAATTPIVLSNGTTHVCQACAERLHIPYTLHGVRHAFDKQDALGLLPRPHDRRGYHLRQTERTEKQREASRAWTRLW